MAWRTIGHLDAKELLAKSHAAGRLSHAYLITGVPSIGRRALAYDIIRLASCKAASAPCGECNSCQRISEERDMVDIHHIKLEQTESGASRKNISIEQIQDLVRIAQRSAYELPYRVFIIDEAERMSSEAANALLKVLEEPEAATKIILLASGTEALPETIVSRTAVLRLSPLGAPTVREALSELDAAGSLGEDELARIVKLAAGRLGLAYKFAREPTLMEAHQQSIERCVEFYKSDMAGKFKFAEEFSFHWRRERAEVLSELERWIMWWRDLAKAKISAAGGAKSAQNPPESAPAEVSAPALPEVTLPEAVRNWEAAVEASVLMHQNVNVRLALEIMALKFANK